MGSPGLHPEPQSDAQCSCHCPSPQDEGHAHAVAFRGRPAHSDWSAHCPSSRTCKLGSSKRLWLDLTKQSLDSRRKLFVFAALKQTQNKTKNTQSTSLLTRLLPVYGRTRKLKPGSSLFQLELLEDTMYFLLFLLHYLQVDKCF